MGNSVLVGWSHGCSEDIPFGFDCRTHVLIPLNQTFIQLKPKSSILLPVMSSKAGSSPQRDLCLDLELAKASEETSRSPTVI